MSNRFATIAATIRISIGRSGIITDGIIGVPIVATTEITAGNRTVITSVITIVDITGITVAGGMAQAVPIDKIMRGARAPFSYGEPCTSFL